MKTFTQTAQKIGTLAYLIEHPRFISLRGRGCNIATVKALNQPWLHKLRFRTIVDIGAHVGKFSIILNKLFPNAFIYGFEPIPVCYKQLVETMKGVDNFLAYNVALGDTNGKLDFSFCEFTAASSFLPITQHHETLISTSSDSKIISVDVRCLDDFINSINLVEPILVKIDVQGFEDKVLAGGAKVIKQAKLILIETSFSELYEEQPLFRDIYELLVSWGFDYIGSLEQMNDPLTGKCLQSDSLFISSRNT